MTDTNEHSNIAAAFVAAQAQFSHVVATKRGQARAATFTYADLADLVEMARPVLAAHGLAFQSHNGHADGGVTCETVLVHTSGETMRSGPTFIAVGSEAGAQAFGSAYTYARRYSLLATLGIAADDDDGTAAMQAQAAKVAAANIVRIDDRQFAILVGIAQLASPTTARDRLEGRYKDLPADDFESTLGAGLDAVVKLAKISADQAGAIREQVSAGAPAEFVLAMLPGEVAA